VKTSHASSCLQTSVEVASAPEITLPPGTPSWITVERVRETMRVCGPRLAEPITVDLAIEMLENVARLADWLYMTRPKQAGPSADAAVATVAQGVTSRGGRARRT
jgi:hypothetical protein